MRAAVYQAAGHVTVEEVPDAALVEPTDAVVRVLRSCVCGSDLWSWRGVIQRPAGLAARARVHRRRRGGRRRGDDRAASGDLVVAPFQWSDNTCPACQDGIQTRCDTAAPSARPARTAGRARPCACRRPTAPSSPSPAGAPRIDDAQLPALLALTDVMATGLHGAVLAGAGEGGTVVVIGDGAVGLCAVLGAPAVLGAERVILMSRHEDRTAVGRSFGATDVVAERGEEGIAAVRELTDGRGARHVVEAVGTPESWEMALGMVRVGGADRRGRRPAHDAAAAALPAVRGTPHRARRHRPGARTTCPTCSSAWSSGTARPGPGLRPHAAAGAGRRRLHARWTSAARSRPSSPVDALPFAVRTHVVPHLNRFSRVGARHNVSPERGQGVAGSGDPRGVVRWRA